MRCDLGSSTQAPASPTLRRVNATHSKALAAASVLLALPSLSSCAHVSFGAQTDQVYTPADGENNREGSIDVLNAFILSATPGSGRLVAGLANPSTGEDDELTGVQGVGEDQDVTFTIGSGETSIPAGGYLQLADEDAAEVTVSGDPEKMKAGTFVRLSFTFKDGEEAELNVPVLEPGVTYADFDLGKAAPSPGATQTPEATETPAEDHGETSSEDH